MSIVVGISGVSVPGSQSSHLLHAHIINAATVIMVMANNFLIRFYFKGL